MHVRTDGSRGTGRDRRDTGAVQALAKELEALIDEAERARAADPRFLEDLRDKIAEYSAAAAVAVPREALIQDDFSDGDITDIARILDEKRQIIRKTGLLEYCQMSEALGSVGGLDQLKAWRGAPIA